MLLLLHLVLLAGLPLKDARIISQMTEGQYKEVHAGDNFTVPCPYNCSSGWIRATWCEYTENTAHPKKCQRINNVTREGDLCTLNLFVDNVTMEKHNTLYFCSLEELDNPQLVVKREREVRLLIRARPSTPVIKTDEEVVAGKRLALRCETEGFFPRNVTMNWFHNGTPIVGTNPQQTIHTQRDGTFSATSNINISLLLLHHDSVVTCQISHISVPAPVQSNITLNVKHAPLFIKMFQVGSADGRKQPVDSNTIITTEGSSLELGCQADGNPISSVRWEKQNTDLSWQEIDTRAAELKWSEMQESNAGVYRCLASNQYGTANVTLTVLVEKPGEFIWLKVLAAAMVTTAVLCAVVALYFFFNSKRNRKDRPSIVISESVDFNETNSEDKDTETGDYAMIWRSSASNDNTADCLTVNEVPYADILITVRGTSTPELRHIPQLTIVDYGQDWRDEERTGQLQGAHSVDRLPVRQLEVTRQMSTSSEYAVINYCSKPRGS
ncbi:signal-regulatory protein beta-1 [Amia ocellicauda]|uniref:signal-regulatory protein beta-1 n=1 Tax=Amia ocellicauda TaxID=2972642 RepID=UPI003463BA90